MSKTSKKSEIEKNEEVFSQNLVPANYEYTHLIGTPFCHLYNPGGPNRYHMDLAVLVPKGKEIYQIDVPNNHMDDSDNNCCNSDPDRLYRYDVRMRDHVDPNHPAETKTYRFPAVFSGDDPSCKDKLAVRIVVDGEEKGKTVIRTKDADSYGG